MLKRSLLDKGDFMHARDLAILLLLAAVWGASFLFMRLGAPEFGPVALICLRMLIAAAFLIPILAMRRRLPELLQNWRQLTMLGIFNSALPFLLLSYSLLYVTAGFSSIINATAPLWGAIVARLWLDERLPASGIAGVILGFAGVVILTADTESLSLPGSGMAAAAAVAGAFFYGLGANYARRYTQHLNSLTVATGSMLFPALILVPAGYCLWPAEQPSARAWLAVLAMGTLSTSFAYILYFRLIASAGPSRAITVAYLIPVFAVFWGALLLDEAITRAMVLGCIVIFLGTALATGVLRRRRPKETG